MAELKVLIVAENPLARMGLAGLLNSLPELTMTGQTGGADLNAELEVSQAEIIVWDWGWGPTPDLPKDIPIVALLKEASQAAEAWGAGARGLLLGSFAAESLGAALVAVAHGLAVIEPSLSSVMGQLNNNPPDALLEQLTPRELEVLQLVAEGLPNKTIASRLSITDHTVKFHVNAIMTKLGVQSRTEAVVRATKLGLIFL
ncbi:MAG: response regulator transcription factor [Anaerolineae bacterium]